jgi:two-component system chemotaxis response regulator CheB
MAQEGFRIVVVVASVGGLDALSHIPSTLPVSFPAALVIVQHRTTSSPHLLAELLRHRTTLTVKDAQDGDDPRPGVVYVAPPGLQLIVDGQKHLALVDGAKVKPARPSGDRLFASAAEAFGPRVIALVLTGGDGDGSGGISVVSNGAEPSFPRTRRARATRACQRRRSRAVASIILCRSHASRRCWGVWQALASTSTQRF